MSARRLETHGLIDRSQRLRFRFDGKACSGFVGDTVASALLANGVRVVGRSFKYHRPRGVWGAWVDDPNAIMSIAKDGREMPNCAAATTPLEQGMDVKAVNAWPSARFDVKAGLDLFHRWLGAGFYYKTFIWPHWHLFEPMIRAMAGLGAVSKNSPDDYIADQRYQSCDLLVIGGGVAGLAAAVAAAERGEGVVLVDDHPEPGGSIYAAVQIEGQLPRAWVETQTKAFGAAGGTLLSRTTAFGIYDHGLVGLVQIGPFGTAPQLIRMRPRRIILAAGALDRPVTFANNDRPGVMSLLGAAQYLARYGVMVADTAVVLSNNSAGDAALDWLSAAGMAQQRLDPERGPICAEGRSTLRAIRQTGQRYPTQVALVSGGLTPLVHLWRHAGGKLAWCNLRQAFLPGAGPDHMQVVGAAAGTFDLEPALADAREVGAGGEAQNALGTYKLAPLWPKPGGAGRQWIDLQHDVTLKDIEQAARENYVSVEHLKRYTTLGMASDQGKGANMAGLAAMAAIQGRPIPDVGTTTFRPPFVPIPIEAWHGPQRGPNLQSLKRLPLEADHREQDAAMCEYGGWLRPGWYGRADTQRAVREECAVARKGAAVFDGSPLGKIEVLGPDAEAFVNFIYYNTIASLQPGHIRYGFMLTEGGIVLDDGVVTRLSTDRFLISCSSGHVDSVRRHLETWRQDDHDPDRIFVHDLTMKSATVVVSGPDARRVMAALDLGIETRPDAFPHMRFVEGSFRATPVRVSRVSFTGEVSYEISLRRDRAGPLWRAALEAGARPIGVEALSVLRAEKGYVMIGKDTDGETMPHDLGFGGPRHKKRAAFVGDRSLHSAQACRTDRKQLVGLRVPTGAPELKVGAHVVEKGAARRSQGYVTSSYSSPTLDRAIALGLVEAGATRLGEEVMIWDAGVGRQATICAPCFLDPKGERLHA